MKHNDNKHEIRHKSIQATYLSLDCEERSMGKKKQNGKCRICGKYKKLTFEHVPPSATYNNSAVKYYILEDYIQSREEGSLPWELYKAKGRISQRGKGDYYLCEECNNNIGSWYGNAYKRFIDTIMLVRSVCIKENLSTVKIQLLDIRPLPIFKQIISMFCDVTEGLSDESSIRDFLLEKRNRSFDGHKYRVSMYILLGEIERTTGLVAQITDENVFLLSEIAAIPVGFILYKECNAIKLPAGTEITEFINYDFDEVSDFTISLNVYETNSWLPTDFRTKKEILETIESNQKWESANRDAIDSIIKNT